DVRTLDVTVIPTIPTVDLGDVSSPVAIDAGGTIERTGRVSGDFGHWTGTVDFGDGSPARALDIAGDGTFELHHVYTAAGRYTAVVRIAGVGGTPAVEELTVTVASHSTSPSSTPSVPLVTIAPGGSTINK